MKVGQRTATGPHMRNWQVGFRLARSVVTGAINGATGGTAWVDTTNGSYSVRALSGAFVDDQGDPVDGEVTLQVTPDGFSGSYGIDNGPGLDIDPSLIGNFTFSAAGQPAVVGPGAEVTIRIPVPADSMYFVGEAVVLFGYDELSDVWQPVAPGAIIVYGGHLFAQADVSGFTWYGLQPVAQSCLNVTVKNENNVPLVGQLVRGEVYPADGSAYYAATTGADGTVCIKTRANTHVTRVTLPGLPATAFTEPSFPHTTEVQTNIAQCGGSGCTPLAITVSVYNCGDGEYDYWSEECDGGANCTSCVCDAPYFPGILYGAGPICVDHFCGDGILDQDETCDPGIVVGGVGSAGCSMDTCECDAGYESVDGFCTPL